MMGAGGGGSAAFPGIPGLLRLVCAACSPWQAAHHDLTRGDRLTAEGDYHLSPRTPSLGSPTLFVLDLDSPQVP